MDLDKKIAKSDEPECKMLSNDIFNDIFALIR